MHPSHTLAVTVDYTYTTSSLTFNNATSSRTVTIPILEDEIVENCEIINVTLSGSSRTVVSTPRASVCIVDNDGKYSPVILTQFVSVHDRTSVLASSKLGMWESFVISLCCKCSLNKVTCM